MQLFTCVCVCLCVSMWVYLCVCVLLCVFVCLPMIEKSGAGSPYRPISPSSRECIPLHFFPSVSAELYMTEALFFSLPLLFCFSAALVTTSSVSEWITDQFQLELVFQCERSDNKKKTVSDIWAQRDRSWNINGLVFFVH